MFGPPVRKRETERYKATLQSQQDTQATVSQVLCGISAALQKVSEVLFLRPTAVLLSVRLRPAKLRKNKKVGLFHHLKNTATVPTRLIPVFRFSVLSQGSLRDATLSTTQKVLNLLVLLSEES